MQVEWQVECEEWTGRMAVEVAGKGPPIKNDTWENLWEKVEGRRVGGSAAPSSECTGLNLTQEETQCIALVCHRWEAQGKCTVYSRNGISSRNSNA